MYCETGTGHRLHACNRSRKNRQKSRITFIFLFVHRCLNGFYSFLFCFVSFPSYFGLLQLTVSTKWGKLCDCDSACIYSSFTKMSVIWFRRYDWLLFAALYLAVIQLPAISVREAHIAATLLGVWHTTFFYVSMCERRNAVNHFYCCLTSI